MNFADLSILVIDDSKFIRDTVRRMLRTIGVGIIRLAPNGMRGLELVTKEKFDVVLCDLSMEPINGMRFVEFLRKHDKQSLRETPVIILTMHNEKEIVEKAIDQGIDGYLLKPVSIKTIKERIEQVLGDPQHAEQPAT
jgi:two-component system chemotaxis response regulator CheY